MVKISMIGKLDMKKFRDLPKVRMSIIKESSSEPIQTHYPIHDIVERIHPKVQNAIITKIIKETQDTKTFVLEPDFTKDTTYFAPFLPGQCVSVYKEIRNMKIRRPYALTSTPKEANQGIYKITVRKVNQGILSSYLLDEAMVGDTLTLSAPFGTFTYNSIRDENHVVAIAGGSGITPFLSLAQAIAEGSLDIKLTIFYGEKKVSNLIGKEILDDIVCKCDKVKVIYVISEEDSTDYEHGFITKEMLDREINGNESIFVSGSYSFYEYISPILEEYSFPKKYVRYASVFYPLTTAEEKTFTLTVIRNKKVTTCKCSSLKPLLNTMEENGMVTRSKCHVGTCGFCRSRLIEGEVMMYGEKLRKADKNSSFIHPCVSYPLSDVTLEIN